MRKHSYNYKPKTKLTLKKKISHFFRTLFEVFISLVILSVLVLMGGLAVNKLHVKLAQADALQTKVWSLQQEKIKVEEEKEILKQKLEASSKVQIDDKTRQIVLYYIRKYFADDYDRAVKVFTCESGLNPQGKNTNIKGVYAGTIDRGVAQVNDHFHAKRFESMNPGIKFEIGAHDIDMNLRYARFLYDSSKGWGPWACRYVLN